MDFMIKAIEEGLSERKIDKESEREKGVASEEEAADRKKYEMVDAGEEEEGTTKKAPTGTGRPRKATPVKRK
jgi:hypothetical protein